MLFCVLLITSQALVWISIPANLRGQALDVISQSKKIELALNLLPFCGHFLPVGSLPWCAIA